MLKRLPAKTFLVVISLLALFTFATINPFSGENPHHTWSQYGGSSDQSKYVDAAQITRENVKDLKVAWVYPTMDSAFNYFSPIVVDTIMYVVAKNSSLVAINAETGKEISQGQGGCIRDRPFLVE